MGDEMTTDPQSRLVSYRQAIPADAPTIRKVLWETWTATYGSFIPENDLRAYFEDHYNDAAIGQLLCEVGVEGHVAECGNIAAGVMITRKNDVEGRFYVSSLYILPAFQGRGIGKGLLDLARTRAMSIGMNALWLGVMVDNVQALAWYRSLGFTFVEELPFRMGKTKVSHLIGFLSLGQPKRSD
jgi:diamine N-acetyltransferase